MSLLDHEPQQPTLFDAPSAQTPAAPQQETGNTRRKLSRGKKIGAWVAGLGIVAGGAGIGVAAASGGNSNTHSGNKLSTADELAKDAKTDPAAFAKVFLSAVLAQDNEATYPYLGAAYKQTLGTSPDAWDATTYHVSRTFSLSAQHPALEADSKVNIQHMQPNDPTPVLASFAGMQGAEGQHYIGIELAYEAGDLRVEAVND